MEFRILAGPSLWGGWLCTPEGDILEYVLPVGFTRLPFSGIVYTGAMPEPPCNILMDPVPTAVDNTQQWTVTTICCLGGYGAAKAVATGKRFAELEIGSLEALTRSLLRVDAHEARRIIALAAIGSKTPAEHLGPILSSGVSIGELVDLGPSITTTAARDAFTITARGLPPVRTPLSRAVIYGNVLKRGAEFSEMHAQFTRACVARFTSAYSPEQDLGPVNGFSKLMDGDGRMFVVPSGAARAVEWLRRSGSKHRVLDSLHGVQAPLIVILAIGGEYTGPGARDPLVDVVKDAHRMNLSSLARRAGQRPLLLIGDPLQLPDPPNRGNCEEDTVSALHVCANVAPVLIVHPPVPSSPGDAFVDSGLAHLRPVVYFSHLLASAAPSDAMAVDGFRVFSACDDDENAVAFYLPLGDEEPPDEGRLIGPHARQSTGYPSAGSQKVPVTPLRGAVKSTGRAPSIFTLAWTGKPLSSRVRLFFDVVAINGNTSTFRALMGVLAALRWTAPGTSVILTDVRGGSLDPLVRAAISAARTKGNRTLFFRTPFVHPWTTLVG